MTTNTIKHHPDDATLMSFAAGSLGDALSAVVAIHLDRCPACRRTYRTLQAVGGAVFEALPAASLQRTAPVIALRRQEADVDGGDRPGSSAVAKLVASDLGKVPWRRLGLGVWHHRLASKSGDLRLLKVAPGRRMPEHGHGGAELTLLLAGSYTDETGTYRVGDVSDLDNDVEHTPIADPVTGCICLIASERPARFKGLIPRIVQPLTGM